MSLNSRSLFNFLGYWKKNPDLVYLVLGNLKDIKISGFSTVKGDTNNYLLLLMLGINSTKEVNMK